MESIVQVQNISSGYDKDLILHEIDFEVEPGQFLGIIGPNGCGKSTLLRTMTRVLTLVQGKVLFRGRDIEEIPLNHLARVCAFVPQETLINFSFSCLEIVLMGRLPYLSRFQSETSRDFEIAHESLKLTDSLHLISRDINELSAGERQRVLIARALAQEPEVLYLDEPTSHLDIGHQTEVFDLLKSLNKDKGLTVVCVLHDLNIAADYCDRMIVLKEGRIKAKGAPEEILDYQLIEQVYNTVVVLEKNPVSGRPHLIPVSKFHLQEAENKKKLYKGGGESIEEEG